MSDSPKVYAEDVGFAAIPRTLEDADISDRAYRLYGMLTGYAAMRDGARPSQATLAKRLRCSKSSVKRAMKELEDGGFLRRERRQGEDGRDLPSHLILPRDPFTGDHPPRSQVDGTPVHEWPTKETYLERDQENEERTSTDVDQHPKIMQVQEADDNATEEQFERFWQRWPKRNGKKLGKQKALSYWRNMTLPERRAAYIGARHYADASQAGMAGAMDAFRWLRDRLWVDWQDPAIADDRQATGPGGVVL